MKHILFRCLSIIALMVCLWPYTASAASDDWNALFLWRDLAPIYSKAPFPSSLHNVPVLLIWNGKHNGDILLCDFAALLRKKVPSVRFITTGGKPLKFFGVPHTMEEAELATHEIRALQPGLVIFATGDCRVCAAWMAVETALLEMQNIPTVALVTQPFYKTYANVCQNMRVPPLTALAVPHPIAILSAEKVRAKAALLFKEFYALFPDKP
ncbi:MAG: hypothetical protein RRY29_06985 [Desulfovibrionaceae bacterium]